MAAEAEDDGEHVFLNVYDLSQGFAARLSQSVVGKQIDGIWHTGVVVFGREYFFQGELQCLPAGRTPFGAPTRTLPLGTTHIPREVVDEFVEALREQYNTSTYALLSRNCNNFSNELALFLTGRGIPPEIVGLPEEFLATPLGAILKPMIQAWEQQTKVAFAQQQPPSFSPISPSSPASAASAAATPTVAQQSPPPPPKAGKLLVRGALPLLSCQGAAKPFITKLRSMQHRTVPEDALAALEGTASTLPQSVFALAEAALVEWGPEECAPLLFLLRSLAAKSRDFVAHYADPAMSDARLKFALGLQRCVQSDLRNCSLLAMATAANLFATDIGAKMMLAEPMASVVIAALDKLKADDATTRLMAAALVHNVAAAGLPSELPESFGARLVDGLASGLLSLHAQEASADEAELRTLVALGLLLLNNRDAIAVRVRENGDLFAFLVSRESETAVPQISQAASEILALLEDE